MTPHNSIIAQAAIHQLIIRGLLSSDMALDASNLADRAGLGPGSWRDALNRLAGEGIIARHGDGRFASNDLDEAGFRHLLDWHERLAYLAVARRAGLGQGIRRRGLCMPAHGAASLFTDLARSTNSASLEQAMRLASTRLAPCLAGEADLFEDLTEEGDALRRAFDGGDASTAHRAIMRYHRRRHVAAALLLKTDEHRRPRLSNHVGRSIEAAESG